MHAHRDRAIKTVLSSSKVVLASPRTIPGKDWSMWRYRHFVACLGVNNVCRVRSSRLPANRWRVNKKSAMYKLQAQAYNHMGSVCKCCKEVLCEQVKRWKSKACRGSKGHRTGQGARRKYKSFWFEEFAHRSSREPAHLQDDRQHNRHGQASLSDPYLRLT